MRLLIVYYSKTGFTKQYAQWLQEDLHGDCIPLPERGQVDFSSYDKVVFGSSVHAGRIRKWKWCWRSLRGMWCNP